MSRGGAPYGSYADPQMNPIANQGAVMASADYDVGAKVAIQLENRDIGPSAYGGVDNEQNFNIAPDDLLFTVPGKHGSKGDVKMAVLPALNGLGAAATQRYATDPDGLAMIREAVKNQIIYVGAPFQYLSSERGNVERGIAVQMGGLKTLRMGNNQFGDDRGDSNMIKPGDILCADVPVPGRDGLAPGVGMRPKHGSPAGKFTLQLRRCTTHSAGRSLRRHIREIVRDPRKWKTAMGEHLAGTKAWATAARRVIDSYLTGGLLMVRELLAAGVLVPSDAGILLGATVVTQQKLTTARGLANAANGALGAGDQATLNSAADEYVLHLAQLYGVIPTNRQNLLAEATRLRGVAATRPFVDRVLTLQGKTINRIFFDGTNRAFEFGFEPRGANGLPSSVARLDMGGVADDKPAGQMLLQQLNHFPMAVAGFHTAIQRDMQFLVGKAATGGSSMGSGNVNVFLSKFH